MALGQVSQALPILSLLLWAMQGFVYLGLFVTPDLQNMYKTSFQLLLKCIHDDLERPASGPLSVLSDQDEYPATPNDSNPIK